MSSVYLNTDTELSHYSPADVAAYLARIGIPAATDLTPSLALLDTLLLAHQLAIPYDSTSLHVRTADWNDPAKTHDPILLGKGQGMELGETSFRRILGGSGGFCYALNTAFAGLLRSLSFNVSELGARVYMHRGKDPAVAGYLWSSITHEVLAVGWEGTQDRYLLDAGFGGGGCPYAMLIEDGSVSRSLSKKESFKLVAEPLPVDSTSLYPDSAPGFTILRRVLPPDTEIVSPETAEQGPGHWTPCYHFTLSTLAPSDIVMANYYNEAHPKAPFIVFFVCSILLASVTEAAEKRKAKLYTKEGLLGKEYDVEWVDFEVGAVREVLKRDFGFKFA